MPRAVPPAVRQAIWNRSRSGQSTTLIAQSLELPCSTVRRLVRQLKQHGQKALMPAYCNCGGRRSAAFEQLRQAALTLRREHPRWGAGRIRVELAGQMSQTSSDRTIQRWLRQAKLSPAPRGRRKASQRSRAQAPHDVWQVDAAEQKKLASGEPVSWLRVADECTGAILKTVVFSRGTLSQGPSGNRSGPVSKAV
jgi:transposase